MRRATAPGGSSPRLVLSLIAAVALQLLGAGSCDDPAQGGDCAQDGSCPSGLTCFPDWRCYAPGSSPDCNPACYGARPLCMKSALRCVECLVDTDCPDGRVCVAPNMRCLPGCSASHPACPEPGQTCDTQGGFCHGCLADGDCKDKANPWCDVPSGHCYPCKPGGTTCAKGQYCQPAGDSYACTAGCADSSMCAPGSECCGNRCVDTRVDNDNCGVCGYACRNGRTCCNGRCADLATDIDHCGSCGHGCVFPNATGITCTTGTCDWRGCEFYYADCDGNHDNGCEVNTTMDPKNCYGCNAPCTKPPHAAPACTVNGCGLGQCEAGWVDCDGSWVDGCEVDVTTFQIDPQNCGGCRKACGANQKCVNGACA